MIARLSPVVREVMIGTGAFAVTIMFLITHAGGAVA